MKNKLIVLAVGILFFCFGWWAKSLKQFSNKIMDDSQKTDSLNMNIDSKEKLSEEEKIKNQNKLNIRDYMSDEKFIHWAPNHPDTTNYMCEITLHDITALYWYHGQCGYDYFTYLTSDTTIEVLWSYRVDCLLDMDFLEKSNGVKNYPKRGDEFATLTLINDTTLQVNYNYPVWVKKVNEIAKDSLFPTFYYLIDDSK